MRRSNRNRKKRRGVAFEALERRNLLAVDPLELEAWAGSGLDVLLDVFNTRTQAAADVVQVGDILEVTRRFDTSNVQGGRAPELFPALVNSHIGIAFDDSHFSLIGDKLSLVGEKVISSLLFVADKPGTGALGTAALTSPSELTVIERLRPEELDPSTRTGELRRDPGYASFLENAVNQAYEEVQIVDGATRPTAMDDQYELALLSVPQIVPNTGGTYADLAMVIDASAGVLANDSAPSGSTLRAVLIESTKHGRLDLRPDGSFEYLPRNDLSSSDTFSYVAVSDDGTSEARTVTIIGLHPPILDIRVRAINEAGESISSVTIGREFFLQVVAQSSRSYGRELSASFNFNSTAVTPTDDVQLNQEFARVWYDVNRNSEGQLTLDTTTSPPTATVRHGGIDVDAPGFRTDKVLDAETELFRARFVASAAGEADFSVTNVGSTLESHLVNLIVEPLTVMAGSVWQNPSSRCDTNGDGIVSPLDVLVSINRLNQIGAGRLPAEKAASDAFFDVNGDGVHTPADVLLVINHLNAPAVPSAEGEAALVVSRPAPEASTNTPTRQASENSDLDGAITALYPISNGSAGNSPRDTSHRTLATDDVSDDLLDAVDNELLTTLAVSRREQ